LRRRWCSSSTWCFLATNDGRPKRCRAHRPRRGA